MNKTINFTKRNFKELLRDPLLYVFCLAFPIAMFFLFFFINKYSGGNTPTFEVKSLTPGIIVFSYSFIMLTLALIVSKDRQTFFLKRLYSSPMKDYDFILGYGLVGMILGVLQTVVCLITAFVISLISKAQFISLQGVLLLIVSNLPILILNVFLGILFGTAFNDKTAPGICSITISISGILGGCWMPLEVMGDFETICRFLPYYPSVYIGRIISGARNTFGYLYKFDYTAILGVITILIYTILSVILTIVTFKKNMVSDN